MAQEFSHKCMSEFNKFQIDNYLSIIEFHWRSLLSYYKKQTCGFINSKKHAERFTMQIFNLDKGQKTHLRLAGSRNECTDHYN